MYKKLSRIIIKKKHLFFYYIKAVGKPQLIIYLFYLLTKITNKFKIYLNNN